MRRPSVRLLILLALALPVAGCVIAARPYPVAAGGIWVPGHYVGWRWAAGHWR